MPRILPWFIGGLALAVIMIVTVAVTKPIGASTEFVVADAIIWDWFNDDIVVSSDTAKSGYESPNEYLNSGGGKMVKAAAAPFENYSVIFVLSIMLGAFLSSRFGGDGPIGSESEMPNIWRRRFGNSKQNRYIAAFIGGFLVLFGSRLAGGCTSGHMLSGIMQTSLSGYLFALATFVTAIPLSFYIYRNTKG